MTGRGLQRLIGLVLALLLFGVLSKSSAGPLSTPPPARAEPAIEPKGAHVCPGGDVWTYRAWTRDARLLNRKGLPVGYSPLGVNLTQYHQMLPPDHGIVGVRFNLLMGCNHSVYGIDLGLFNLARRSGGIAVGLWNDSAKFSGVMLGLRNNSDVTHGAQIGVFNSSHQLTGVGLGVFGNVSEALDGAMVGLFLNEIRGGAAEPASEAKSGAAKKPPIGTGLMLAVGINDYDRREPGSRLFAIQIAGFFNSAASSRTYGLQLAGGANFSHDLTGLQLSAIFQWAGDVRGAQISGVAGLAEKVRGLQIAPYYASAGGVIGAQLAGIMARADSVTGLQAALFTGSGEVRVAQLGLVNYSSGCVRGVQVGAINVASCVAGVQVGLFNYTERMSGLQIGLLNIITQGAVPVMPLINFSMTF